jgi:hypothetical protein
MAKTKEKIEALQLRREGKSIMEISHLTGIAKSTVSVWCRDISLTPSQMESLVQNTQFRLRSGQLLGAEQKRRVRLEKVQKYLDEGQERFQNITKDEHFVAGLALYLGEGAKTGRRFHFVNANPRIIRFMLDWLHRFFSIPRLGVTPSIVINEMHRPRIETVLNFWSRYLEIPESQFGKTVFVKTAQKKTYENYHTYYGTLRFQVLKGTELSYIISGLMEGLLQHIPMPV